MLSVDAEAKRQVHEIELLRMKVEAVEDISRDNERLKVANARTQSELVDLEQRFDFLDREKKIIVEKCELRIILCTGFVYISI